MRLADEVLEATAALFATRAAGGGNLRFWEAFPKSMPAQYIFTRAKGKPTAVTAPSVIGDINSAVSNRRSNQSTSNPSTIGSPKAPPAAPTSNTVIIWQKSPSSGVAMFSGAAGAPALLSPAIAWTSRLILAGTRG